MVRCVPVSSGLSYRARDSSLCPSTPHLQTHSETCLATLLWQFEWCARVLLRSIKGEGQCQGFRSDPGVLVTLRSGD